MLNKKTQFFVVLCFSIILQLGTLGCCSNYRYLRVKNKAENALEKKDFEKAKDLYSLIYQKESEADPPKVEKLTWAFYRLGVINELMNETNLAKGYYWGDRIDEGFYASEPRIEWYAEAGWQWLDQNNPPRALKEILELEKKGRPAGKRVVRRKKEVKVRKRLPKNSPSNLPGNSPTRVFNRSLTPPSPSTPEPFRVYY